MAKSVSFSRTAVTVTPSTTDNIVEGTNLFYTISRANSAIDARVETSINSAVSALSTNDISEGTNLYHTPLRVRQSLISGTGITVNNQTGVISLSSSVVTSVGGTGGSVSNAQIAAGISRATISNLNVSGNVVANYFVGNGAGLTGIVSDLSGYATTSNLALKANIADLTTSNVSEGINLYFTNARSRSAISVSGSGSYDNSTGVITITGGVSSVGGATGAVSNAQLAAGIISNGIMDDVIVFNFLLSGM